jgi:predicted transcriptional regulator
VSDIISVSVPRDVRSALDSEARSQRRSRSFIVAEAVRAYVKSRSQEAFSNARHQTLREGLALSPPSRVKLAEELWQELSRGRQATEPWARTFGTYAEYETWRRQGGG